MVSHNEEELLFDDCSLISSVAPYHFNKIPKVETVHVQCFIADIAKFTGHDFAYTVYNHLIKHHPAFVTACYKFIASPPGNNDLYYSYLRGYVDLVTGKSKKDLAENIVIADSKQNHKIFCRGGNPPDSDKSISSQHQRISHHLNTDLHFHQHQLQIPRIYCRGGNPPSDSPQLDQSQQHRASYSYDNKSGYSLNRNKSELHRSGSKSQRNLYHGNEDANFQSIPHQDVDLKPSWNDDTDSKQCSDDLIANEETPMGSASEPIEFKKWISKFYRLNNKNRYWYLFAKDNKTEEKYMHLISDERIPEEQRVIWRHNKQIIDKIYPKKNNEKRLPLTLESELLLTASNVESVTKEINDILNYLEQQYKDKEFMIGVRFKKKHGDINWPDVHWKHLYEVSGDQSTKIVYIIDVLKGLTTTLRFTADSWHNKNLIYDTLQRYEQIYISIANKFIDLLKMQAWIPPVPYTVTFDWQNAKQKGKKEMYLRYIIEYRKEDALLVYMAYQRYLHCQGNDVKAVLYQVLITKYEHEAVKLSIRAQKERKSLGLNCDHRNILQQS